MPDIKKLSVFCGSSSGSDPVYAEMALLLGRTLAVRGIEIVYGGASVGLMGAVADGALAAGGKVTGIFPGFLQYLEIAHKGISELIIVESMHERKTMMNALCDGVIALPGGFGTLEELFEMLTWAQLGLHDKPVALLNIDGYYDHLKKLTENMVIKGFLKEENREMLIIEDDIEVMLYKLMNYSAPDVKKWLDEYKT
jgi:uncharacterized protein (TIGR00730 family)